MMIKVVSPSSWQFNEKVAEEVKMSSRGLVGEDLHQFIKRAGNRLANRFRSLSFEPGEVPVHLIALGATEFHGPNRNGDGFKEATCLRYHHTFVTKPVTKEGAYFFRDHANKNPLRSYGIVKDSDFNEDMKRVELIVALNGTEDAAERNGGLVAENELQKLASGQEIPVSMSCRVPFDKCSGCGHESPSRANYCTAEMCKYGGLRDNMGRVADDGHILHADNPDPRFFDISHVFRPADRIAYVLGHAKTASGGCVGGAALAEMYGLTSLDRDGLLAPFSRKQVLLKLAAEASLIENKISDSPEMSRNSANLALDPSHGLLHPLEALEELAKSAHVRDSVLDAMSASQFLLPVRSYLIFWQKNAELSDKVARRLPGVFGRLAEQDPETAFASVAEDGLVLSLSSDKRRWVEKHAAHYSLQPPHLQERAKRAALRGCQPRLPTGSDKEASVSEEIESLAKSYAIYQLLFMEKWSSDRSELDRLQELIVRQNYLAAA